MKKLCVLLLTAAMLLSCVPTFAADASIVQTFKASYTTEQGKDNFRYVQFDGNKATDLTWNAGSSRWVGNPNGLIKADMLSPGSTCDIGMVFTAPKKGVVKMEGDIVWPYAFTDSGMDGVKIYITKGDETLFEADCPYSVTAPYDIEVDVRKGDQIFFRVNCKKHNSYDQIRSWPSVSYVAKAYQGTAGRDGYQYLQRKDGQLTELTYDEAAEVFRATDGVAYMNDYEMMATEECSMVTRYTVKETGKQRVTASLKTFDRRGGGNVINVYHNEKLMWQQLVPEGETGQVDVRFVANQDDIIDIEVATNTFTGFNYGEWSTDVKKFDGSEPFSSASSSQGDNYSVDEEFKLSSKIGASQGNGVGIYGEVFGNKFPMTYDTSSKTWSVTVPGNSKSCSVTSEKITTAAGMGTPRIELDITKTGTIKIDGTLPQSGATTGMLARILLNDKEIWSSHVGGSRGAKFNDPIDIAYFVNDVDVVADVKEGDTLAFAFSNWASTTSSSMSIKDVSIKYISGDILSATTKWKIGKSTIIDTVANKVYVDGQKKNVDLVVKNGTTYISEADASSIPSLDTSVEKRTINNKTYIPIRIAAENLGKTVTWGADRLIVIHDGISAFFGTAEFSEMSAALKGGDLID